ncbi:HAD-like domain-containing protein [Pseudoscourfieldia marina]
MALNPDDEVEARELDRVTDKLKVHDSQKLEEGVSAAIVKGVGERYDGQSKQFSTWYSYVFCHLLTCILFVFYFINKYYCMLKYNTRMRPGSYSLKQCRHMYFDVDGTLVLSDHLHLRAFQQLCGSYGCEHTIDESFFASHISGRENKDISLKLFPSWSLEKRNSFSDEKEALFRDMCSSQSTDGGILEVPGARAFLSLLVERNISVTAVTNAPRENGVLMLGATGFLSDFFEDGKRVVYGSECKRAKPFPDPYVTAMTLTNLVTSEEADLLLAGNQDDSAALQEKTQNGMAFEDSPSGIRAAVAAGLYVVGLTTGHSEETLRAAGAHAVASDYHDLMSLFE